MPPESEYPLDADNDPNAPVTIACPECGTQVETSAELLAVFGPCVCKACSDAWDARHGLISHEERKRQNRERHWQEICPQAFRHNDWENERFRLAMEKCRKWDWGNRSLILQGASGACKTRCMFEVLKPFHEAGDEVAIVWQEDLTEAARAHPSTQGERLRTWSRIRWLGLDDALLVGAADERVRAFLKTLIDMRTRHHLRFVLTTQLGSKDFRTGSEKWDKKDAAALESTQAQVDALLRRLGEFCFVVRL